MDASAGVTAQPEDVLPIFHLTSCVPLALTGSCLEWFFFAVTLKFDFFKNITAVYSTKILDNERSESNEQNEEHLECADIVKCSRCTNVLQRAMGVVRTTKM